MKRILPVILPLIVLSSLVLYKTDVLDISMLQIKSHELKLTELAYGWHYAAGDVFTRSERVRINNYEDALLAIKPDYSMLLQDDLDEIAANRDEIRRIDAMSQTIQTDNYNIRLCIEEKNIKRVDSTLFTSYVNVEVLGQLELYDKDFCDLLYVDKNLKYWIRDKIIFTGLASDKFIDNKLNEIWLSQVSDLTRGIVNQYEYPYRRAFRKKAWKAIFLYFNGFDPTKSSVSLASF